MHVAVKKKQKLKEIYQHLFKVTLYNYSAWALTKAHFQPDLFNVLYRSLAC